MKRRKIAGFLLNMHGYSLKFCKGGIYGSKKAEAVWVETESNRRSSWIETMEPERNVYR